MKLFIKKFKDHYTADTWWIYYAKDGKGYAIYGTYNYHKARNTLRNHRRNGSTEDHFKFLHLQTVRTYSTDPTIYLHALIVNE